MKVLVSAYACEPNHGSEPAVGWNWVTQIATFADVTVITRENNRYSIEKELVTKEISNLHFIYYDLPRWLCFWKHGTRGLHLYYLLWQKGVFYVAKRLHDDSKFDIVHHLTFGNAFLTPSFYRLPATFVWGPMGMDPAIPWRMYRSLGLRSTFEHITRQAAYFLSSISPSIFMAQRKARRIIVSLETCKRAVHSPYRKKIEVVSQIQVSSAAVADSPKTYEAIGNQFKILTSGRLVPKKGFPLAIRAFALFSKSHPDATLTITGDGPLLDSLKKLAHHLGVTEHVIFVGMLKTHEQVMQTMRQHDAFLFTTFEAGGMVVIEAMSKALPVICLNFGGPGEFVTEYCGIKVPVTSPEHVVQGLADALSLLASDPAFYEKLSRGAIERVRQHYIGESLGKKIKKIYEEVLHSA